MMRRTLVTVAMATAIMLASMAELKAMDAEGMKKNGYPVNVTGTTSDGGTFTGTFAIKKFQRRGNQIVAKGRLTGTITKANGETVELRKGKQGRDDDDDDDDGGGDSYLMAPGINVVMPVSVANATCDILNLQLGPLNLDLLGLVVDLDQVNLDITAQQGQGKLLGNLLCGVAGLLDGVAKLNQLIGKLNQVLDVLIR